MSIPGVKIRFAMTPENNNTVILLAHTCLKNTPEGSSALSTIWFFAASTGVGVDTFPSLIGQSW